MSSEFLLGYSFPPSAFFVPCNLFVEETGLFVLQFLVVWGFADCIPQMSNMSLCPYVSCKYVVTSRDLTRFYADLLVRSFDRWVVFCTHCQHT